MAADDKIEQIDNGLSRFYEKHNRDDYYDDDGNGKFKAFCEEWGYDDEEIEHQLNNGYNAGDCDLVNFDVGFPFYKESKAIFKVIIDCYKDCDAYSLDLKYTPLTIQPHTFDIDEKVMDELSTKYKVHCRTLFERGLENANDAVIWKLLHVGKKTNNTQYLQCIVDLYARDKLRHYLEIKKKQKENVNVQIKKLTVQEWVEMNQHTLKIKSICKNDKAVDILKSAVDTFYRRTCPLMGVRSQIKIIDSYEPICEYISAAADFVANLARERHLNCPFQYDCCFAFNEVRMPSDIHSKLDHGDGDDDDDDDDDDDEHDDNEYFYDCFMNIKERFKSEQLVFVPEENDEQQKQEQDAKHSKRFKNQYELFRSTLKKRHQSDNDEEFEQYPHRFRFISILDRREPKDNPGKGVSDKDELIFVEPTSDCYKLPKHKQCDNLWYFNSSKTEIIPKIGYNDENNTGYDKKLAQNIKNEEAKEENDVKKKLQTQTVNTDHPMKNAMLLLSFHVDSQEEIRCYMYLGACMMRFFADDLRNYLPQFFEQTKENEAYINGEDIEYVIKNIKERLVDLRFKAFEREYKTDDNKIKQHVDKKWQKQLEDIKNNAMNYND